MDHPPQSPQVSGAPIERRGLPWLGAALFASLATLALPPGRVRILAIEVLCFLPPVLAAGLAARRAGREPAFRRAWIWLAWAMGLQALSHLVRMRWELTGLPFPPSPNLADALQVGVLPLLLFGLVAWPSAGGHPGWRRRCLLDALVFMGSLFFLFWQLGLREFTRLAGPDPLAAAAYFSSFFLAALVFAYWVYLVVPGRTLPSRALLWMGLFLLGGTLVNLAGLLVGLRGTYAPGHWVDAVLPLVLGFAVMAAWAPGPGESAPPQAEYGQNPYLSLLPYLPMLGAFGLVLWQLLFDRRQLDWQAVALGLPVVGLLLLRQFLALEDVHSLTSGLEEKIHDRTQALESAQELLLQTERMNSVAVLGAGMAHDLKNLLGIVTNYALLMTQDVHEGRPVDPEDLDSIHMAASQAVALAHQLMAFGREDEDLETPSRYELGERLRSLVSLLRAALPLSISLEVVVPGEPLMLKGDPRQFDQLLANLVLNARDAISGQGGITVAAGRGTLRDGRLAGMLEVRDTGCGMSPETMTHLFQPFFTTKAKGKGTGLGLASIRAIVDHAGGTIEAESHPGEGTVFRVRLPLV